VTAPGSLIAALSTRYRIERELGRGGMATVYLAHDLQHDRLIALKVLRPELAAALGPERFLQEIRTAARLQHPHILPVFDSGDAGGILWYSMPFVEGESLRQRLQREKQLPIEDAVRLGDQVLSALAYAHSHDVIHRDIKPENILLHGDQAVIADLGIARVIGATSAERLTEAGLAVGTPAYMSPEQAAGERDLDRRSDLYSVGTVLYEAIAGEPPFTGPTAQAVIARRLTESPRSLRSSREAVPAVVEQAIMKALSRAPADRHESATAFSRALQLPALGDSKEKTPARIAWKPIAATLAIVIGLLVLAGLVRSRSVSRTTLDSSLIAVAPFDVLDPKLQLWHEGLVDLLSRNLDGAGPLRTVSPTVVVRRWSGRADPASAEALGRRTGAGLALYGSILGAGPDSVRLRATLLDVSRGTALEEWELGEHADRIDKLSDSLTLRVLRGLGRTRPIGSVRLTGFGSTSLPVLKAFLQGEQYLRHTDWDSALVYYQRAIDVDSTFAPALRRASTALGWIRTGHDSLSNAYAIRAGINNHGLPVRDSLFIAADSVFASLLTAGPLGFRADSAWGIRLRQFFDMVKQITARYPSDPEAWWLQGEADNHLGPLADRSESDMLQSFDRAIEFDSAFAPSYIHQIETAANQGPDAVRRYLVPFIKLTENDPGADGARLVQVLLDSNPTPADQLKLFRKVSDQGLFSAYLVLSHLPDSTEYVVGLSRFIARHPLSVPPLDTPLAVSRSYARALMSRGHIRAGSKDFPSPNVGTFPLFVEAALLGGIGIDTAAEAFRERLAGPMDASLIHAFPWWAAHRDTVSLHRAEMRADSLARWSGNPLVRQRARYGGSSAAAYLALVRNDTTGAIRRFVDLPRHSCPACYLDRLTLAQLLVDAGRDQEAWSIVSAAHPSSSLAPFPTQVLWNLLRARVAERRGDRNLAIQSYAWVTGMWQHPDPQLQPYVIEAREGLARLTAEGR
jgi:eukaryotic-like serine/threonine-protein kinase